MRYIPEALTLGGGDQGVLEGVHGTEGAATPAILRAVLQKLRAGAADWSER
jgi:hypothetical protein